MKLAHINTALLVLILVVCSYILLMPFVPMVSFWFESRGGRLAALSSSLSIPVAKQTAIPEDNRLVVPSMLLNAPINEGNDISALRKDTWRRPNTSTPDKGGNTVIVAHRFTYTDPRGPFYYLDKVHVNDEIGIFWKSKRYVYKVTEVRTVHADQTNIENNTPDAQLTLYSCTPLWYPKDRLVVTAKLEPQV
jgi:LPXTG-site transpeptidase (sortase) family protein